MKKQTSSSLPLDDTPAAQNEPEGATVEGERTSTHNHECKGGEREDMGLWMGTSIQLTGTSFQYHLEGDYPVCRDKRGQGGTDEEQEQRD